MKIDKAEAFGEVIASALNDMAADYREMADGLRRLALLVPEIGQQQGLSTLTATDIVLDALRRTNRGSLSLTVLVRAAADYERNVSGLEEA
jgi:hypothetical protein